MGCRTALVALAGRLTALILGVATRGRVRGRSFRVRLPFHLRIAHGAVVVIGDGVLIESHSRIVVRQTLKIGDGTYIGKNVTIVAFDDVIIGDEVLIAENVSLHTENHGPSWRRENFSSEPVAVGDRAWLGAGAVVLQGVTVGASSTVGANAVVRENVPANSLAVGVPARIIPKDGL